MSIYLPVKKFEVNIEKINESDFVYLVIKINDYNYFRFPYNESNIATDLIENFKHIINGKDKTIGMNNGLNYNLIMFQKDHFTFSLMNENNDSIKLIQEFRLVFENNSIVRNGLRTFIDEHKKFYN